MVGIAGSKFEFESELRRERTVADFIPYSHLIGPSTVITRAGDLMRTWKIDGLPFQTETDEELARRKNELNMMYRSLAATFPIAIWIHDTPHFSGDRLPGVFTNSFARDLDKKYYDTLALKNMMARDIYFTIIYKASTAVGGLGGAIQSAQSREDSIKLTRKRMEDMEAITLQVNAALRIYGAELLTVYQDEDNKSVWYSRTLEFLNYLLSGNWQRVRVPKTPLHRYLGTAWMFAGDNVIRLRDVRRSRFGMALDFKDYGNQTEAGMFNQLFYTDIEFVVTQSFSFIDKNKGDSFLKRLRTQFNNANDGSVSQIAELDDALEGLANGEFAMGEYHYSMMVYGNSRREVQENTAKIHEIIQRSGFLVSAISIANDAAYYAQLPGNWNERPRVATLTSLNFAGMASLHNFYCGKRNGNPWGDAVTVLKTQSNQAFYFNFHYANDKLDQFGAKILGNTRIIGQAGSGKTAFMAFLLSQIQKFRTGGYRQTNIVLDKDRGFEIAVRVLGGKYLVIRNNEPTGFNPFQLEPTGDNITFLRRLIVWIVARGGEVTSEDLSRIELALIAVMSMEPKRARCLTTFCQNLNEGVTQAERKNSVLRRLKEWCRGGAYGWVFDNDVDLIDFTTHDNYGFDGTAFLSNPEVCAPISMYLLHRMESIIDGRRFIYWMDEARSWLADDSEAFVEFVGNKQVTIRKQNGFGVITTQMPSTLLGSGVAAELAQQCATEIYLANPKAEFNDYVLGFKCTVEEYQTIKNFSEASRYMLIKQGQQSAIVRFDLTGFSDELIVLSGSTDNVELMDELIDRYGEDPEKWLPELRRRVYARKTIKAQSVPSTATVAQSVEKESA